MNFRSLISKYLFSTVLLLVGLIVTIMALTGGQNNNVLIGSVVLILAGGITLLYAMEIIKKGLQNVLLGVVLLGAIGIAFLNYKVIDDKLKFQAAAEARRDVVKERLLEIRTAQKAHKAEKGMYAKTFDQLINFITKDSIREIMAIGVVPDSVESEAEALALGIIKRDTIATPVMDKLFPEGVSIDSLPLIPFGNGEQFAIDAGTIERNNLQVPVFEVFAKYQFIYTGMNTGEYDVDLEDGMRLGSMTEPTTSGNWE